MKAKLEQNQKDDESRPKRSFVIETDEDCQVAQDKLDALEVIDRDDGVEDERSALKRAIAAWHARKKC